VPGLVEWITRQGKCGDDVARPDVIAQHGPYMLVPSTSVDEASVLHHGKERRPYASKGNGGGATAVPLASWRCTTACAIVPL